MIEANINRMRTAARDLKDKAAAIDNYLERYQSGATVITYTAQQKQAALTGLQALLQAADDARDVVAAIYAATEPM